MKVLHGDVHHDVDARLYVRKYNLLAFSTPILFVLNHAIRNPTSL